MSAHEAKEFVEKSSKLMLFDGRRENFEQTHQKQNQKHL